jgi:hypothetical protein
VSTGRQRESVNELDGASQVPLPTRPIRVKIYDFPAVRGLQFPYNLAIGRAPQLSVSNTIKIQTNGTQSHPETRLKIRRDKFFLFWRHA